MNFRGAGEGHICGGERFVYELSFIFLLFLSKLTAIIAVIVLENEPNILCDQDLCCTCLFFTLSL